MFRFIVTMLILVAAIAVAEVPHQISYQGRVLDDMGVPLEGEHEVVFTIYDLPEGGTALWTSGSQSVHFSNGLFSYDLGMHSPIPDSVFFQHFERWLGISVDGGPESTPRVFFNSTAFAYHSRSTDSAGFAALADNAFWAEHATVADDAIESWHSVYSDTADFAEFAHIAEESGYAAYADTAEYARAAAGGTSGWTHDGSIVRLTNTYDFVGIGTTIPSSRLTVDNGNIRILGTQNWGHVGDTAKLILGDGNHGIASIYGEGVRLWTFSGPDHTIAFGGQNGANYMTVSNSGCVAINSSLDEDHRLTAFQLSGPGKVALCGRIGVSNPSFGGGIGVKGIFGSDGVGGVGVYGSATALDQLGGLVGVYGHTDDPTSYAIYGEGGMAATGPISNIIQTKSYGVRETYALQSAGNWCEDFGSSSLTDGVARVEIESIFAETARLDLAYHVFLTPLGDCGLYVAEKAAGYFTVKSYDGRLCTVDFDYRIVAKRAGYEDRRLRSADGILETSRSIHTADR